MSYEHVIWEQDGAVGRVTLNRPDSLNAWTDAFGRELKQVIERDAADPAVRAVRFLRPGLREHRADAGWRLDPVRAGRRGQGTRFPDGAARRADRFPPGARVGSRQLRASRRPPAAGGRGAYGKAGGGPHPLVRELEARAEPHALPRPRRPARSRGRAAARA